MHFVHAFVWFQYVVRSKQVNNKNHPDNYDKWRETGKDINKPKKRGIL